MKQFFSRKHKILSSSLTIMSAVTLSACNMGVTSNGSTAASELNSLAIESDSSWNVVGNAGFSLNSASFQNMDIAPDGTLYLSYTDNWNSTVMKFNGSNWEVVGEPGFAYGNQSIAIAPAGTPQSGTPYVAYGSGDASVMKFDGKNWVYVGEPMFAEGVYGGYAPTLAIAPKTGTPYVAYSYSTDEVKVMKFNGEEWVGVGDAFGQGYGDSTPTAENLVIASDGTPFIAFDATQQSMKNTMWTPVVMKFNGNDWGLVGSALETSPKQGVSMVLDSTNTPYIAYIIPKRTKDFPFITSAPEGLAVKRFNTATNSWEGVGMGKDPLSKLEYPIVTDAEHPSLAIASDGGLYVSYTNTANGNKANVMKFNGNTWEKLGSEDFSTGSATMQNLKISNNNLPHLSFIDGSQNNKTTVMKFMH